MLFPRNWLCVDCLEWNGILSYSCCYIGGFVITSWKYEKRFRRQTSESTTPSLY